MVATTAIRPPRATARLLSCGERGFSCCDTKVLGWPACVENVILTEPVPELRAGAVSSQLPGCARFRCQCELASAQHGFQAPATYKALPETWHSCTSRQAMGPRTSALSQAAPAMWPNKWGSGAFSRQSPCVGSTGAAPGRSQRSHILPAIPVPGRWREVGPIVFFFGSGAKVKRCNFAQKT
jgi:hypothetical protein